MNEKSMRAKHTPGPWTLTENKNRTHNGSWFEIDGGMTRIADIPASTNPMWDFVSSYQNGIANARLIAAAPELLEALKLLVDDRHPEFIPSYKWKQARAAIAKAIG